MRIKVLDISPTTCNFLTSRYSSLGSFEHFKVDTNQPIPQIAKQVSSSKYDALFINIECPYELSNRSGLKGIELIFWLRFKYKYTGAIITYGFLSSAQILRLYPQYIVIHAPGNMHWRLGDEMEVEGMPKGIKSIKGFLPYLHPFVDISAIRHSYANHYSLKRLQQFHYAIIAENITISTPGETTQELVYNSLFEDNLQSGIASDAENSLNESIEEIKEQISELMENLKPKGKKWAGRGRPLDMYNWDKEILQDMDSKDENFSFISSRFTKSKKIVEDWKTELESLEYQLSARLAMKENQSKKLIEKHRKEQLKLKITELRKLKRCVALVDDMARQGWKDFYSTLLSPDITLTSFVPATKYIDFNPTRFATDILGVNPDVVLLDLRLFATEDTTTYPSGIKVLTELRKLNPIVPIIVCSASNRGTTINLAHLKGANFYWLKEGLDLENSVEDGIKNYERLLDLLLLVLANDQIQIQKLFRHFVRSTYHIEKFWWEDKDWQFEHTIKGEDALAYQTVIEKTTKVESPNDIINTVLSVLTRFSRLLSERQNKKRVDDWKENSEIVLRLGRLIEHIHRFDLIDQKYDLIRNNSDQYGHYYQHMRANSNVLIHGFQKGGKSIVLGRNDKKGNRLYELRNKAAHFASANLFGNEETLIFIEKFLKYLIIEDNSAYNDKTVYEKNRNYYWDIDCKQSV